MANYTLPDLPYDYAALEPHISATIMQLHHDKHHQAYVTGANTALEQLAEARDSGNLANVNKLEKDLAFNLGGHVNHSIFWTNLSPDGGDKPDGELAVRRSTTTSARSTSSQAHFTAAATGRAGLRLGRCSSGTRSARTSSSSSSSTSSPTSRRAPCRCCCSTCGSTRTTSTT